MINVNNNCPLYYIKLKILVIHKLIKKNLRFMVKYKYTMIMCSYYNNYL